MSINYDTPSSAAALDISLAQNPSVSPSTITAINSVLGVSSPTTVVTVGSYNGTTLITPTSTPQVVIATLSGNTVIDFPAITLTANAVIFDTDFDVEAEFGTTTLADGDIVYGIDRVVSSGNGDDILTFSDNGNTTVDGSAGNDSITTTAGADSITGGTGNDTIMSGAGNDTIVSGVGQDSVDGGIGFDVVQVAGTAAQWGVSVSDNSEVILTNASNTVTATDIDFISFTDATGAQTSVVVVGSTNEANAMRLYQGLLDRSADQGGAQYWETQVAAGESTQTVANAFMASQEYITDYGTQTNSQFVNQIYENAFGRSADAGGLAYWVGTLDQGASRAGVAVAIVGSPEAISSIDNVVFVEGLI